MSYCSWDQSSELSIKYHDSEWGVPLHDDRGQFEFLMMEVMQCGLNWTMMINKREIFRSCFDNFEDYEQFGRRNQREGRNQHKNRNNNKPDRPSQIVDGLPPSNNPDLLRGLTIDRL